MKSENVIVKAMSMLLAAIMLMSLVACGDDTTMNTTNPAITVNTGSVTGSPTVSDDAAPPTGAPNHSSLSNATVGDIIKFGQYEQDNNTANGKEEIEWIVLDKDKNMLLVTSVYVLDTKQYNTTEANVTWKTSSLRSLLNGGFFKSSFSSVEQSKIVVTVVETDYNVEGVRDEKLVESTNDRVFLLSVGEAYKYLESSEERSIYGTAYAMSKGLNTIPDNDLIEEIRRNKCDWWLRDYLSNGYNVGCCLSYIDDSGDIGTYAATVEGLGVRPAMWIAVGDTSNDTPVKTPDVGNIYSVSNLSKADVGDTVKFGKYEQDNNTSNGKEDIEWTVLDKKDNRILVISNYVLDAEPYNAARERVTWETCTIRMWLNYIFLNSAFSVDEQSKIATTLLENGDTSHYAESPYAGSNIDSNILATYAPEHYMTDGGNDTYDKLFLLSTGELHKYLDSEYAQKTYGTKYTSEKIGSENCSKWWLRSPGKSNSYALYVSGYGFVHPDGDYVDSKDIGIRPAMWINI